jgi:hypothetical protein
MDWWRLAQVERSNREWKIPVAHGLSFLRNHCDCKRGNRVGKQEKRLMTAKRRAANDLNQPIFGGFPHFNQESLIFHS